MTAEADFIQSLDRIQSEIEAETVWMPATIEIVKGEARYKNTIAGNVKTTKALSHISVQSKGIRNGKPVVFTTTIHKGESNFLKSQDVAEDGQYVDETRPGAPALMNVHREFIGDRRQSIPLDGSAPVIKCYGRAVRKARSDVDKWATIMSHSIVKAKKIMLIKNGSALQKTSDATEAIVNVKASNTGIAKQHRRAVQ